jgi:hypothetical protein
MQPEGIAAGADLNHPSGSSNVVHISPTGISSAPIASTPIAGPEQHPIASKCGSPLLESASDVENMQVDSNSQTLMSPKSWSTGQKHATGALALLSFCSNSFFYRFVLLNIFSGNRSAIAGAELTRTAKRARRTASMPAHLSARPLGSGYVRLRSSFI